MKKIIIILPDGLTYKIIESNNSLEITIQNQSVALTKKQAVVEKSSRVLLRHAAKRIFEYRRFTGKATSGIRIRNIVSDGTGGTGGTGPRVSVISRGSRGSRKK